jgi:hypothetical protein
MSITNLTLLNNIVFGTPSGNYDGSSLDFTSDGVKGVGYYPGQGSLETALIRLSDFQGLLRFRATLDVDWHRANWFDVYDFDSVSAPSTLVHAENFTGNFTWVQVEVVNFTGGTINSITLSY